jgi:hypothetical protein
MTRRTVLLAITFPLLAGAAGGVMRVADFGAYWSAARANLTGGNPYDPALLLPHQQQIEPGRPAALPIWAPPWAVAFVTPAAWPDFPAARWAWLAATAAGVGWAVMELWAVYGGPPDRRWAALVLGFTFYPVLQLLGLGQVSAATLFAVAGFVVAQARGRSFAAGLFAALVLVKLQVAGFFALAVLLRALDRRDWRMILGGLVGAAALTALVVVPNPAVFAQYRAAMAEGGPSEWIPPTPGTLLRVLAGGAFWPALVPPAAGVLGVTAWYALKRKQWDWRRAAPVLAFVGFFCSPYAWVYDQCVLLVPLVAAAAGCTGRRLVVLLAVHAAITAAALAMNAADRQEYEFGWLAPAVLGVWWVFGRSRSP